MAVDKSILGVEHPKTTAEHPDRVIARLAARQHGVVARQQLVRADVTAEAIKVRLATGRLHRLHTGVYAVGHRVVSQRGRWMAAVLAGGPGAVLSHRAAAALWRIRNGSAIEITTPRRCRRRGVLVHTARLRADEVTVVDGIPVTTVPRTLLDLAAVAPAHQVEAAANEADYLRLTDPLSLGDLVTRHPHRPGIAALRRLAHVAPARTRSDLEALFLAFLDAHGLPRPQTNTYIESVEADCVWRDQRLIVELDGYAAHRTRKRFFSDRTRDRRLTIAGWTVLRVTEDDLINDAARLAADLRALLSRA